MKKLIDGKWNGTVLVENDGNIRYGNGKGARPDIFDTNLYLIYAMCFGTLFIQYIVRYIIIDCIYTYV